VKKEEYQMLCYYNTLLDRAILEIIAESKTKVDIGRWLKAIRAPKRIAEEVLETLARLRAELQTAVEDPDSPQREGYSYLTKPKLTRYYKFATDSHEDTVSYIDHQYPKKVRKKKPVDPEKIVKNLKFQAKDEPLGLTSVPPKDILGATMFVAYNTKSRVLTYYKSKGTEGFSIKGSTLTGWDEDHSLSKRMRKPEEVLAKFANAGFAQVEPRFVEIKTKPSKPNGRINSSTVLVWARRVAR